MWWYDGSHGCQCTAAVIAFPKTAAGCSHVVLLCSKKNVHDPLCHLGIYGVLPSYSLRHGIYRSNYRWEDGFTNVAIENNGDSNPFQAADASSTKKFRPLIKVRFSGGISSVYMNLVPLTRYFFQFAQRASVKGFQNVVPLQGHVLSLSCPCQRQLAPNYSEKTCIIEVDT